MARVFRWLPRLVGRIRADNTADNKRHSASRKQHSAGSGSSNGSTDAIQKLQGTRKRITIAAVTLIAVGQTTTDPLTSMYADVSNLILSLLMIAIPIFVVVAVVRMIFNHLRA